MRSHLAPAMRPDVYRRNPAISVYKVNRDQRQEGEPDPFTVVCAAMARKQDWRLTMLSILTLSGLMVVLSTGFLSRYPTKENPQNIVAVASSPDNNNPGHGIPITPLTLALVSPTQLLTASGPFNRELNNVSSTNTPKGWGSQEAYDEWSPKFNASLSID